jgi:hypothetical protein
MAGASAASMIRRNEQDQQHERRFGRNGLERAEMDSVRSTTAQQRKPQLLPRTTSRLHDIEIRVKRRIQELNKGFANPEKHLEDDSPFVFEVLTGIYTIAYDLAQDEAAREQWLSRGGLRVHGNTVNPHQPVVKSFFPKSIHPAIRHRVCRWAKAIAHCYDENISPREFESYLRKTTIKKAVAAYNRSLRGSDPLHDAEKQLDAQDRAISQILSAPEQASLSEPCPVTIGVVGKRRLAVLEFEPDGSGRYRILGVLAYEHDAVVRIVLASARRSPS